MTCLESESFFFFHCVFFHKYTPVDNNRTENVRSVSFVYIFDIHATSSSSSSSWSSTRCCCCCYWCCCFYRVFTVCLCIVYIVCVTNTFTLILTTTNRLHKSFINNSRTVPVAHARTLTHHQRVCWDRV